MSDTHFLVSPFRITLIFIVLTVIGIASTYLLEVNFAPKATGSSFNISFSSESNDPPLVTEQKVTAVLEGALSAIEGIKDIESVSRFGGGNITLSFESTVNLAKKRLEILTAIRQVRKDLPENMPFPTINVGSQENVIEPLLIFSLTSSLPTNEIVALTNAKVIPKLGRNPGVKSVALSTDMRPCLVLTYDLDQLRSVGLRSLDIQNSLYEVVRNEQIGTVTSKGTTQSLFVNTTPDDITDLLNIRLTNSLRLGDIASLKIEDLRPTYISRLNGKNSILIRVFAHENENKPRLATELLDEVEGIKAVLSPNMEMKLAYNDTDFINKELVKIGKRAGLSMFILALLVVIVYRKMSQLIVLIGSVVVCVGITSLLMYLLAIPVHLYTIAGLTISFGLVIDNSIMVIDHVRRKKDLKVITALLAATLTTIAALLVIFILPPEEREGMDDFAMAISISLVASVVVSLLFTPALSWLIGSRIKQRGNERKLRYKKKHVLVQQFYYRTVVFLCRYRKAVIIGLIFLFGLPVYFIPKSIEGLPLYNSTIGSEVYQDRIRPFSDKVLGGMLRSFYLNVFESSGYRTPEKTKLYITASLREGHTIEQMDQIIRNVEEYLVKVKGLDNFRTSVYSGKYAQVIIEFLEETENGSLPYILKNRLIQRSLDWGGVDWSVYGVGRGFSNASSESLPSFRVKLKGYNYYDLEKLSDNLASMLLTHPRIKEVNTNDRISWQDVNSEQLVMTPNKSVFLESYQESLEELSNGSPKLTPANSISINNTQLPLIFRDTRSPSFSIFRLQNESWSMPLLTSTELQSEVKSSALYRENREYIRVLSFEYFGSYRFGDEYLKQVLDSYVFPVGYSHERILQQWGSDKIKRQYALIVLILLLIFVICAATFESLKLPLSVIFLIPLSFIGVFITFSWGGFYFDQGGYAAFILLAGIVVNATIFILNQVKNFTSKDWNRNVIKACYRKFLPIILTIISTCLGLVPFLIDGQKEIFWFSFAVGVIGGLLFSVFLVFIIFPVLLFIRE